MSNVAPGILSHLSRLLPPNISGELVLFSSVPPSLLLTLLSLPPPFFTSLLLGGPEDLGPATLPAPHGQLGQRSYSQDHPQPSSRGIARDSIDIGHLPMV
jgi:hypothetical protein